MTVKPVLATASTEPTFIVGSVWESGERHNATPGGSTAMLGVEMKKGYLKLMAWLAGFAFVAPLVVNAQEVEGYIYRSPAMIQPRWAVNSYTPEQINGYHHIRIGASALSTTARGESRKGLTTCDAKLLGATLFPDRTVTDENLRKACASSMTIEAARNRLAYMQGKRKFYFRSGDFLFVNWDRQIQKMVLSMNQVVHPMWDEMRFWNEGRGFDAVQRDAQGLGQTENLRNLRFQALLDKSLNDHPWVKNAYNTVYFTIGEPRRQDLSRTSGTDGYVIPISVDRIELSDGQQQIVLDYTTK